MRIPASFNATAGKRLRRSQLQTIEKSIRRIVRAHDLQSRALAKVSGLTAAQLAVMRGIVALGEVTSAALSAYADISAATVVIVLDNLEERGLVERYRSGSDRRIVHTKLTDRGLAAIAAAPPALGNDFVRRFNLLDAAAQRSLVEAAVALADLLSPTAVSRERLSAGRQFHPGEAEDDEGRIV